MATAKKGNGTAARRRTTARKTAGTAQHHDGEHLRNQAAAAEPAIEAIRARAYELFLARGGAHGNDLDDWFAAERELRAPRAP